jgi:branched-chain amino acid transport system ATP-binding protein
MLKLSQVCAGYGRATILRDVSFEVNPGEVVVVLGRNGVGKSTLLKTIAGLLRPQQGTITFNGRDLGSSEPYVRARSGLRLVLEGHRVFPELTVRKNLEIGYMSARAQGIALDEVLDLFPQLSGKLEQRADGLSGGQQQMLALAQALVSDPLTLLCDEPSQGVAELLLQGIFDFVRAQADRGTGVLLVEQRADLALAVADRFVLLDQGEVALTGSPADPEARARLQAIYMGEVV